MKNGQCRKRLKTAVNIGNDCPFSIVHCQLKKELFYSSFLSGLYELLPAFGTGDGDLTLALGYSHLLMAPGTIVVTVILVFYFLEKEEKFSVLFITLINISGEGADNSDDHKRIGNGREDHLDQSTGKQSSQHGETKTRAENGHIQLIGAVAAFHKTLKTCAQFIANLSQPVSKSVHIMLLGMIS